MARTGSVAHTSGATVVVGATAAAVEVACDGAFRGAAARSGPEHAVTTTMTDITDVSASRGTRAIVARNVEAVTSLTPTCVWRATPDLVVALDARFGEPVDAYINGSQVWLRDDGPGGMTIEWRLHPAPGYRRPTSIDTYEVFSTTAHALATGGGAAAPLDALWDGLEAFPAYGEEIEPAVLATVVTDALGRAPDAAGVVDHEGIGRDWERTGGRTSIVDALFAQLLG
jgi:hypothetical protein